MNNETDKAKLSEVIAKETRLSQDIANAFLDELFSEIKNDLIEESVCKVEGLGLFRVIISGESKRILYLGSKERIDRELDLSEAEIPRPAYSLEATEGEIDGSNDTPDSDFDPNRLDSEYQESPLFVEIENHTESIALNEANKFIANNKQNPKAKYQYIDSRKMNLLKTCIATLAILLVVSIAYIVLSSNSSKPNERNHSEMGFSEIENKDTLAFHRVIIPQVDVSMQYISRIYYGDEIYWPYIYMANKDAANKKLVVRGGTSIRIPRVVVDLASVYDGSVETDAKSLAKDITMMISNE